MDNRFLEVATSAAKEAGKILMSHYGNADVTFKNERFDVGSMVTLADQESETNIVETLKRQFPTHGVCGEEGTSINRTADYVWFIDPLDGTSNFTRNIPLFGVSLGLTHKGEPIVGVLYFPTLNLLVSAAKNKGAYANGKKIQVSGRSLEKSLYYAGGKFNNKNQINNSLLENVGLVKIISASSFEFAQIAMGDAEIYYLVNSPHDVVAGVCIVREAGGRVTDQDGAPWKLDSKMILATNGTVHDQALHLIRG